jgi:hypothetical protein
VDSFSSLGLAVLIGLSLVIVGAIIKNPSVVNLGVGILEKPLIVAITKGIKAGDAENTKTVEFVNNSGSPIKVAIYSYDGMHQWPNVGKMWPMHSGIAQSHGLICQYNQQKICFGATDYSGSKSWGVGNSGRNACSKCCVTCDGQKSSFVLNQ